MEKVIKFIYSLVKVLPLVGELLEVFTRKQETPNRSNNSKSSKDFDVTDY